MTRIASRLVVVALFIGTLAPVVSLAATLEINWRSTSFRSLGSNYTTLPTREGDTFFEVNGFPLPTYSVPGMHKMLPNGDLTNLLNAQFSTSLLTVGANDFYFTINTDGGNANTISEEVVWLTGPGISPLPLFHVFRDGRGFEGATTASFKLEQIDPAMAAALDRLQKAILESREEIVAAATEYTDLAEQLDQLAALEGELTAFMQHDLDLIDPSELDALLAKYDALPQDVREALVELVESAKTSIAELRAQIAIINAAIDTLARDAEATLLAAVTAEGVDPSDMGAYQIVPGNFDTPDIPAPDVTGTHPFDPNTDPYAAYADAVIARLEGFLANGTIIARADFLSVIRGWRANQATLNEALEARATVTREEWAAFLSARARVNSWIGTFLDSNDWFKDKEIPESLKQQVDGVLMALLPHQAQSLKTNINALPPGPASFEEKVLFDTVEALGAGLSAMLQNGTQLLQNELTAVTSVIDGAISVAGQLGRVAVSFTPAGDFLDLCEALTGRELCVSSGASMSIEDRVAAGLGVVIGNKFFWQGVGMAIGGVIAKNVDLLDDLPLDELKALAARLGETTLAHLGKLTGTEIKQLTEKLGETFVKEFAPFVGARLKELEKLDVFHFEAPIRAAIAANGAKVKALPALKDKTMSEIHAMLPPKDGWVAVSRSDQTIYHHADGSVVRVSHTGYPDRPFAHVKKEISSSPNTYGVKDILCKLTDDSAVPVPAGPNHAIEGLRQWFRSANSMKTGASGVAPNALQLDQLKQLYFDSTHPPLK